MTLLGTARDSGIVVVACLVVACSAPCSSDPHADSGHALFITHGHWRLVFSARLMSAAEILLRNSIIKSLFIKKQVILGTGNSQ